MANRGNTLPAYIRTEYDASGDGYKKMEQAAADALGRTRRQFDESFGSIKATVAAALSSPRNAFGSLDLGSAGLRQAAADAQAHAIALREVATAAERAALATGDNSEATRIYLQAARAAAIEGERNASAALRQAEATEQLQLQLNSASSKTLAIVGGQVRYSDALARTTANTGAARQASVMLGQQIQDVTVQMVSGQNAFIVFAQQIPQAAYAMQGFGGTVGRVSGFLSGTWGAAILAAVAGAGMLISALRETETAFKRLESASDGLSDAQGTLGDMFDLTTGKLKQQNDMLRLNAQLMAYNLRSEALTERAKAGAARKDAGQYSWSALWNENVPLRFMFDERNTDARKMLDQVMRGKMDPNAAFDRATKIDFSGLDISRDDYIGAIRDIVSSRMKDKTADEILKTLETGKLSEFFKKAPTGRSGKSAAGNLAEFAEDAASKIARINEQFDEQPSAVDRAAQATRALDDIISDLARRQPPNFEGMIAQAEAAKRVIAEGMDRPLRDFIEAGRQDLVIGQLRLQGRHDEAAAMIDVLQLQRTMKPLTEAQVADVLDLVQAQRKVAEAIEDQQRRLDIYRQSVSEVQSIFEGLLSGKGGNPLKALQGAFKDMQIRLVSDQIFGGLQREIERMVSGPSGLDKANEALAKGVDTTGSALEVLIQSLQNAARRIDETSTGTPRLAYDIPAANDNVTGGDNNEIVVTARRSAAEIARGGDKAAQNMQSGAAVMERIFGRAASNLFKILGVQLPAQLQNVIGSAGAGYAQGGIPGALIGAAKGIKGVGAKLDGLFKTNGVLDKMSGGAATGSMVAGIGKSLGIKMSTTGAQIGGSIGAALPIPGGDIIGSIIGGLIGGALKKTKKGTATLGYDPYGNLAISGTGGNSQSRIKAASASANSIIGTLNNIAEQLGGTLGGTIGVSVGMRNKKYVVDTSGQGLTKGSTVTKFKDETDALKFAIQDAIKDGVIQGLRAGTQRLIQGAGELETQLAKAVKFESVFKSLKAELDPVGAAIDEINLRFVELRRIFAEAGASTAEYSQLEQLYAIERKKAVEQAAASMTSTLKQLMSDLTVNNDALSLRERLAAATKAYNPLAARVKAGDTTVDYEAYAEAARNMLDIQRELYGSQNEYFTSLSAVTNLTSKALADQQKAISVATGASTPFSTPTTAPTTGATSANDNTNVVNAIGSLQGSTIGQLATLNGSNAGIAAVLTRIEQRLVVGGNQITSLNF